MLYLESEFVEVEEAYLKQNQTTRNTRLDQKLMQSKLFRLWENYDEKREKNGIYKLLKRVAILYTKKLSWLNDKLIACKNMCKKITSWLNFSLSNIQIHRPQAQSYKF
jgi:hypothetical protein